MLPRSERADVETASNTCFWVLQQDPGASAISEILSCAPKAYWFNSRRESVLSQGVPKTRVSLIGGSISPVGVSEGVHASEKPNRTE